MFNRSIIRTQPATFISTIKTRTVKKLIEHYKRTRDEFRIYYEKLVLEFSIHIQIRIVFMSNFAATCLLRYG